jgi:hypothetical protein
VLESEAADVMCYEDEEYVYFFCYDGTVAGVMAAYLYDGDSDRENDPWVLLSEDEAVALAKSALLKFCDNYTEETADRFTVEADHTEAGNIPHYPEWRISFTEYSAGGIRRNTASVEIDTAGRVAAVFFGHRSDLSDEELDEVEYISEETAVSLALDQLKAKGYEVDLEHFTVKAALGENNELVSWVLKFEEIKGADGSYARPWQQAYFITLDARTGDCIRMSVGR